MMILPIQEKLNGSIISSQHNGGKSSSRKKIYEPRRYDPVLKSSVEQIGRLDSIVYEYAD